jgi:hypothetical protein
LVVEHVVPHVPQLVMVSLGIQVPLQQMSAPPLHGVLLAFGVVPQVPLALQTAVRHSLVVEHVVPHVPQLVMVSLGIQVPLQQMSPPPVPHGVLLAFGVVPQVPLALQTAVRHSLAGGGQSLER